MSSLKNKKFGDRWITIDNIETGMIRRKHDFKEALEDRLIVNPGEMRFNHAKNRSNGD